MKAFCAVLLISFAVVCSAADNSGKYDPGKYNSYGGKYMHRNDGRYVPMNDRAYKHVHDQRELGYYRHIPFPYIHVDNPYMGGYGPYYGMNYPYLHEGNDFDASSPLEVSKPSNWYLPVPYTYDYPKPELPLTYGFPIVASPSHHEITSNILPLEAPPLPPGVSLSRSSHVERSSANLPGVAPDLILSTINPENPPSQSSPLQSSSPLPFTDLPEDLLVLRKKRSLTHLN